MITSAEEFVALLASENLEEQQLAAHMSATHEVWLDVIHRYPDMRVWVAYNKTIPLSILHILAKDHDPHVRSAVALKRKLDATTLTEMANDEDSGVRYIVARHKNTPISVLEMLLDDPWDEVVAEVRKRITKD